MAPLRADFASLISIFDSVNAVIWVCISCLSVRMNSELSNSIYKCLFFLQFRCSIKILSVQSVTFTLFTFVIFSVILSQCSFSTFFLVPKKKNREKYSYIRQVGSWRILHLACRWETASPVGAIWKHSCNGGPLKRTCLLICCKIMAETFCYS